MQRKLKKLKIPAAAVLIACFIFSAGVALSSEITAAAAPQNKVAKAATPLPIDEAVSLEDFTYSISFWIFKEVAIGKVAIKKLSDEEYVATLSAWTTGAINKFILKRKDTYTSRMGISADGKSFITKSFEKRVDIGKRKQRRTLHEIDYEAGVVTKKSWRGEKLSNSTETMIKPGLTYYGPLTAFYNFRFGALGPIEEGMVYKITTFPKDGKDVDIILKVATSDELKKLKSKKKKHAKHYVMLTVDKDILESESGIVDLLFNEAMVPVEAVARDIILFGDVTGRLTDMGVPMELEKKAEAGAGE